MNKVYKLVWSKVRNCYVAVSELAKSRTKAPGRSGVTRTVAAGVLACVISCGAVMPVWAAPDGIETGTGSIARGDYSISTGKNSTAIGVGAVATGDNMTRESIEAALANNRRIQSGLETARSEYQDALYNYGQAKTAFDNANETYNYVNAAMTQINGWQDEINNTLQPNATNANNAYLDAKNAYDTLYNDLQNRLANIKFIDFSLYENGSSTGYDIDAMASQLKTDTEQGTTINMPQTFYKNYVLNYIKAEGDMRVNLDIATKGRVSGSTITNPYQGNVGNTDITVNPAYAYFDATQSQEVCDSFIQMGLGNNSLSVALLKQLGLITNTTYSAIYAKDGSITTYTAAGGDASRVKERIAVYPSLRSALTLYGGTRYSQLNLNSIRTLSALDETAYNNSITDLNKRKNAYLSSYSNLMNDTVNGGLLSSTEASAAVARYTNLINNEYDATKICYDIARCQYLYEQAKSTYGANSSQALSYLAQKEQLERQYASFDFTTDDYYTDTHLSGGGGYYITNVDLAKNLIRKITDWYKENVYDVQDATKVALQELQDSFEAELLAKKQAMEQAKQNKDNADRALANKQQQINNRMPTQQQLDEAATVQDKADELERQRQKLEADAQALEDAKAQLDNLTDLQDVGENALAFGTNALTTGKNAIGIGTSALVTGENAVGIGKNVIATGKNSVVLGADNTASAENAIVVGNSSAVTGERSISIGNNNIVSGNNSVAIGNNLNVTEDNVVDFGTRKGTGLKQATLSKTSTDAVTGAQLYATNQNIAGFASDIKKNKDNISNLNTSVTAALESVSAASSLVNVIDTLKADASLNNLTAVGRQVISTAAADAVQEYMKTHHGHNTEEGTNSNSQSNMLNTSLRTMSTPRQAVDPVFMSLMSVNPAPADTNYVVYDDTTADTITLEGANGTKVTNVANGSIVSGSTDAVTGGQLYDITQQLDAKADITYVDNEVASVRTALNSKADTSYVDNQLSLKADKSSVYTKSETDGLLVNKADVSYVDSGLAQKADKTAVQEALALKADKDTVYTKVETDDLFVGKTDMKDALEKKADKDASNIDAQKWADALGTGAIASGDSNLVKGDTVYQALRQMDIKHGAVESDFVNGQIRVGGSSLYDSVDIVNIAKADGAGRVLHGVATDPNNPMSAANVGYVNAIGQNISESVNARFGTMDDKINKVGANAAAMASLMPPSFDGDEKWALSAAMGNYRSASAGAVGVFYRPQDNITMNLRGSFGSEENMVGGGVTVALQRGNTPGVSKAQLVRAVNSQAQEIQNMKSERAADKAEIAELKAQVAQMAEMMRQQKEPKQ